MSISIKEARPPYVAFETRAVEDRAGSLSAGHYVAKDVDYAIVTPLGSKDRFEYIVTEWFDRLAREVQESRFPADWLQAFRAGYAAWKEGREVPTSGTPVVNWPAVSPAQLKLLLDLRLRTIEDVAAANEETLTRLGMGGRALKERAAAWLSAASETGKVAEQLQSLASENAALKARNASMQEQLNDLARQLAAMKQPA